MPMDVFALDRDLLAAEPSLFRDVVWTGQRLFKATATTLQTTLLASSSDLGFTDAGVEAGHVVVIDGMPLEVINRIDDVQLEVSRLRAARDGAVQAAPSINEKPAWCVSFLPQIAAVHEAIVRAAGLTPAANSDAPMAGAPTPTIVNVDELRVVEVTGALASIFAAAAGMAGGVGMAHPPKAGGAAAGLWARAEHWRRAHMSAWRRARVLIDMNGDGAADVERVLSMGLLVRA